MPVTEKDRKAMLPEFTTFAERVVREGRAASYGPYADVSATRDADGSVTINLLCGNVLVAERTRANATAEEVVRVLYGVMESAVQGLEGN